MDDTQPSRVSDAGAAATRKRRSSILKSQRPARTPFSELEFNVATPTDTAKSRRVSFSRRTGVAEFVTNEATTTWKNFYEEHNKSHESSSNDYEANASRQPVGHLGKRIFDQQFEEVEAVDFISGLAHDHESLNNVNFSHQLVSLECTGEGELTAPHNKFELSAFTEQSKLFGNDFTAPSIGENSGRIDVNFSAIQQVEKDDLDEIEKDLGRGSNNMGCHGPFSDGRNMSEYIEVDLNMTQAVQNDEDMSITDTIHSPVQDVSKSVSIDKKVSPNNDWVADKENIAINPYAAPSESNFAVNEETDQVLVFDGKRLTLQPDIPEKDKNYRQTLLPDSSAETPQRKTIVINVNDDLPNFIDLRTCMKTDEDEISDTIPDIKPKRKTIHDITGNISMTQALPTNIICQTAAIIHDVNATKRRTIVFNESTNNVSVTETVPVKLLSSSRTMIERRRTLLYEDDGGNISIRQAIPSNILVNEDRGTTNKHKTIVFDSDEDNISVTQAITSNIFDEASRTKPIVFDVDVGNMSFTQALPANIMLLDKQTREKRRTIIYESDTGDISVTQAVPANVILPNNEPNPERRGTIVYEDDTDNISFSQALPSNILQEIVQLDENKENNKANVPTTQSLPNNITDKDTDTSRRRTIVYENDTGNISMTQAIPTQLIPGYCEDEPFDAFNTSRKPRNRKRTTIVYDNDEGDISMTEAIPANIIVEATNERKTIVYDEDDANIATTLAISTNVFLLDKLDSAENCVKNPEEIKEEKEKVIDYKVYEQDAPNPTGDGLQDDQKSIVFNADDINSDMSMTMAIPKVQSIRETEKRKTVIFDNENCDISMTKPIPAELITFETELLHKSKTIILDATEPDLGANPQSDVIVMQASTTSNKTSLHSSKSIRETEKRKTVIFDNENCDISMTKPIPAELITFGTELLHKSRTEILDATKPDLGANPQSDVIVMQASTTSNKPSLHSSKNEQDDLKNTNDVCRNMTSDSKEASSFNIADDIIPSPVVDVSANASLLHPRLEQKLNKFNLTSSSSETNVDKVSEGENDAVIQTDSVEKNTSPLPSQLTMSATSEDSVTEDKNFMAHIESNPSSGSLKQDTGDNSSNESMFYITKDNDNDTQTDREADNEGKRAEPKELTYAHSQTLQLEYKEEEPVQIDNLQMKLAELQTAVSEKNDFSNRLFEEVVSSDLEDVEKDENVKYRKESHNFKQANKTVSSDLEDVEKDENVKYTKECHTFKQANDTVSSDLEDVEEDENVKYRKECHTFKQANDTQELLDMISSFTNNRDSDDGIEPAVKLKRHSEVTEHKRLSFAPKRQSIALSREDLLNNISMAQAALQKSRLALDDSDCPDEDTRDASVEISKKSCRTSNEVVKTLQFDDESISETSFKFDTKYSPLKKTAFGETSYMNETKGKVIPTYLKDVSDGVKELMLDLVKPMNDTLPFESVVGDKDIKKIPSTQSTQIQANLVTSSQVDLEDKLLCNTDTNTDTDKESSLSAALNKSKSRSLRSPVKFSGVSSGISSEFDVPNAKQTYLHSPSHGPVEPAPHNVLVFDQLNPLNNILLAPINCSGVHRYNPKKSVDTVCGNETSRSTGIHLNESSRNSDYEVEKVTTAQYHMETRTTAMEEDVYVYKKQDDQFSMQSTSPSRPISLDQSISKIKLRDDEVNTMIAMKGNKELLETRSSLTLVDDAFDGESRPLSPDHRIKLSRSNLIDIEEQVAEIENIAKSPESALSEIIDSTNQRTKGKKRIYSPVTEKYKQYQSTVEATPPKPITKIQKMSITPSPNKATIVSKVIELPSITIDESTHKMAPEKDVSETSERSTEKNGNTSKIREKKSPKAEKTKQGEAITVQQMLIDYHNLDSDSKRISEKQLSEDLNLKPKTESFSAFSQSDVSFTSSKNANSMKDVNSSSTTDCQSPQQSPGTRQVMPSQMDWHPTLMSATNSNLCGSDSGVNVVAKIDMLPFMGSHECEWESSPADTWSFRLLHGRLRLTARLAHRHDNATRTRVRGDTAVLDIAVETMQHDRKNPVATMAVRFACETMRYMLARSTRATCYASDIPLLLRRCAAVARVALRWGRAMHDAKLHLAYTLDNDGNLSLKVANIPLRSVWEVTMRIELLLDDNGCVPFPRACNVHVARVVSDVPVPDAEVQRALTNTPRDWGHAPRTIWRIFRYLKQKTRNDNLLLA